MLTQSERSGEVITFYSYKGGVGRSMALANVARCASSTIDRSSQRILVIDWDLDAPGLHRFFPKVQSGGGAAAPGLIDYFKLLRLQLESDRQFADALWNDNALETYAARVPIDEFVIRNAAPNIDLMLAGQFNDKYQETVLEFRWPEFYEKYSVAIRLFRELITSRYRYCFVDSRTGYTDISGICTALMPEKLVALFVPNEQNLEGLLKMIEIAVEYRRGSDDSRPLSVFPVASRIDNAEQNEKQSWLRRFQYAFEGLFTRLYGSECDLTVHFDKVQLPNVSYYSYGERVAMLDEDRSQTGSLRSAYEIFSERLITAAYPWDSGQSS